MALTISFYDTAKISSPQVFSSYFSQMSEYRQNKINKYKKQSDKNLSLAVGILIQQGLAQYGIKEKTTVYTHNQNGKPFIKKHPEIHFNVSHSGTFAMAVFADSEVGCDIEKIQPIDLNLSYRFFCPEECEIIFSQKKISTQTELFYRFWTIKESFIKATGFGLSLPMDKIKVNLNDKIICPVKGFTNKPYYFEEIDCPQQTTGFKASVCASIATPIEILNSLL